MTPIITSTPDMPDTPDSTEPYSVTLTGKVLLAMPGMTDPRFHRAVILICAHDENGAMGLVINQEFTGLDLPQLLEQLDIRPQGGKAAMIPDIPVMNGGPIENARGFLLHTNDFFQEDSVAVGPSLSVTGTVDALRAVAHGKHPEKMAFILGYAGWDGGQLDEELQQNVWLVSEADESLIFTIPAEQKWADAMGRLGIDPALLSGVAGRA